jgi:hypothetical protein
MGQWNSPPQTWLSESPRSGRGHLAHGEAVGGHEEDAISPGRGDVWNFFTQKHMDGLLQTGPDVAPCGARSKEII